MSQSQLHNEPAVEPYLTSGRVGVVIPTYNAAGHWDALQAGLDEQGVPPSQIAVIDSSSNDGTRVLAKNAGYRVVCIPKEEFNHGATRQMAAGFFPNAEILIYLTQDAVPHGRESMKRLSDAFNDPSVGAACGRQIAREEAGPIERHARLFNYPPLSNCRTLDSRKNIGIKAAFLSNSFGAYRRSALEQVGGFPANTIVNEDMTVAARMLLAGWKVVYQADAAVVHSHPLSFRHEFSRYFDTGVYHSREKWIMEDFGGVGGEGRRFVMSEIKYLWRTSAFLIPICALRTINKWCGYQLGLNERYIPLQIKTRLSSQKNFWQTQNSQ